jgi:hypothetical protein
MMAQVPHSCHLLALDGLSGEKRLHLGVEIG